MKIFALVAAVVALVAADSARAQCGVSCAQQVTVVRSVQYAPVQLVQVQQVQYATVQVPVVQSQVAVVPVYANFANVNYGYSNAVFARQSYGNQVIVVNQNRRADRRAGSGAVGIVGAVARTGANIVGAVIGR